MRKIMRYRLVADEGKILTNGKHRGAVVDCSAEDADNWYEEDYVEEETKDAD